MDPKQELARIRAAMKSYVNREDLTDDEAEKLADLNSQAVKLQARIAAEEQLAQADVEDKARIEREKQEAVAEARRDEAAKHRRLQSADAPYASQFSEVNKYDELSAAEVALVIDVLNANNKPVSGAAFKALTLKIGELKDRSNTESGEHAVSYAKNAFKAATGIEASPEGTAAAVKAATDPMYTGGSLIGSDWVGTAYSSDIWQAIRAGNFIVSRIPERVVPDGFSSLYIPLESTDPTWYMVAEATAADSTLKVPAATVTASQMATAVKQLTLGKLGARVMYTGEMVEDSLIAFAPQLRAQLVKSGADTLEHVAIDGDVETSASKNINAIDTTPAAGTVYLMTNGFRALPLILNTANSRSAGGALTINDYIDTLKLMGTAGLAGADPREVAFIVDYNVHYANLKLPEAQTRDVFSAATFEKGFLRQAFGYDVIPAFQMHKASAKRMANSAGKIDADTDSNNTLGAILAVRFDQWVQAFKRRMTLETTRIANADSWEIVALMRWGLAYRDTEASAISYNVGV